MNWIMANLRIELQ
jgi:hypothetical protein